MIRQGNLTGITGSFCKAPTISALLTVSVVGWKDSSEWLVGRAPERSQEVVTSTVVRSEACDPRTRHVRRVRTLEWVQLRRCGWVFLQYTGQMCH